MRSQHCSLMANKSSPFHKPVPHLDLTISAPTHHQSRLSVPCHTVDQTIAMSSCHLLNWVTRLKQVNQSEASIEMTNRNTVLPPLDPTQPVLLQSRPSLTVCPLNWNSGKCHISMLFFSCYRQPPLTRPVDIVKLMHLSSPLWSLTLPAKL